MFTNSTNSLNGSGHTSKSGGGNGGGSGSGGGSGNGSNHTSNKKRSGGRNKTQLSHAASVTSIGNMLRSSGASSLFDSQMSITDPNNSSQRNTAGSTSVGMFSSHNVDDFSESQSAATTQQTVAESFDKELFAAEREAKLAVCVRALFFVVMIVGAALVATGTYRYTSSQQAEAFETKFYEFGYGMVNAIELNAEKIIESYQTWSLQVTNLALATNQTWPNVTIPHFELQALQSSQYMGARVIGLAPIISNIYEWGEYSTENVDTWVQQALDEYDDDYDYFHGTNDVVVDHVHDHDYNANSTAIMQDLEELNKNDTNDNNSKSENQINVDDIQPPPYVYHRTPPPIRPATQPIVDDIYLPIWQVYPLQENYYIINFDAFNFTFVPRVYNRIIQHSNGQPVLSEGFFVPTATGNPEPESFMAAPVYDNVFGGKHARKNKELVGMLFAFFPWTTHFEDLLPEGSPQVCVVVMNDCVQPFTFTVNGPNVTFVGMGDLHDTSYGPLEVSWAYKETFVDVPDCTNTIHIYPTSEFEESYETSTPAILTVCAVCIFVFTMIVFAIYDSYSQKWRKKVEVAAKRNSAIVQSLFPANVRERLMGNVDDDNGEFGDRYNNKSIGNINGNDTNYQNGDIAAANSERAHAGGVNPFAVTRLPDLIPDLRGLTNKIPDLRNLNPMRLLEEITNITVKENQQQSQEQGSNRRASYSGGIYSHKNNNGKQSSTLFRREDKPIADLFPSATVLFGDISGFTAWSSERDPAQVFTLLESIYNAFDKIANRRRVFKVETIGDCYMAATGLPETRYDHAVVMAGFARECLVTMNEVVRDLEARLGPDTSDLAMRFGFHSGPVTAGVLRGEKSRFQLFGDTVNTAARMESTGVRHKIQISQETADLLIAAGKESWVRPRKDLVEAKGKGRLQTYWLAVGSAGPTSLAHAAAKNPSASKISFQPPRRDSIATNNWDGSAAQVVPSVDDVVRTVNQRIERMIDWNVQVLLKHLTNIVLYRQKQNESQSIVGDPIQIRPESASGGRDDMSLSRRSYATDQSGNSSFGDSFHLSASPPLPQVVGPAVSRAAIEELRQFVTAIAFMYQDNPFHSFEHASHVTQSVSKLLSRLVEPTVPNESIDPNSNEAKRLKLQIHTFESAADPTLRFAVAFSALVHDVDHPGVPNTQLIKENKVLSDQYNGRSVAEKNSIDIGWQLLMEPGFKELRECLFPTPSNVAHFRRLVVKTVMATDIADKEMSNLRRQRWTDQFDSETVSISEAEMEKRSEMFMECLIQASDVSHTMQHWHIFIKWNERLFHECYHAYQTGRAASDPSENWYKGELSFFDFYIIPLIARLKLLEVFGATTDQFMTYALANRKEWEIKGKDIVKKYVSTYKERAFEEEDSVIES